MKKVEVDEELCISCGLCADVAPDVFEVDGISRVVGNVTNENEENVMEAANSCPTEAIKVEE